MGLNGLSCGREWNRRTVVEDAASGRRCPGVWRSSAAASRTGQRQCQFAGVPAPVIQQLAAIVKTIDEVDPTYATTRRQLYA